MSVRSEPFSQTQASVVVAAFRVHCLGRRFGLRPEGLPRVECEEEVEVADGVDAHAVMDGGGCDVDSLCDFGVAVAVELEAEKLSGGAVAGVAHPNAVACWVVGLMVGIGINDSFIHPADLVAIGIVTAAEAEEYAAMHPTEATVA